MSETVIADDVHIKGEITAAGDVELNGTVEGEIICRSLLIATDARLVGKATAEKVVVRGSAEANIKAVHITLASSAKVKGEIMCKAFSVDEDAQFDGTTQRVNDPLGLDDTSKAGMGGNFSKPSDDKSTTDSGGNVQSPASITPQTSG